MRNLNSIICIVLMFALYSNSIKVNKSKELNTNASLMNLKVSYTMLGCFKDSSPRDLSVEMGVVATVKDCSTKCASYRFFAMQYTGYCFCSNESNRKYGSNPCPAGSNQNGPDWGGWNNYVWDQGTGTTSTTKTSCKYALLGCFKDQGDRDLNINKGEVKSVEECSIRCASYRYFGMQYDGECRCSNDSNRKWGAKPCPKGSNKNGPGWGSYNNYVWDRQGDCSNEPNLEELIKCQSLNKFGDACTSCTNTFCKSCFEGYMMDYTNKEQSCKSCSTEYCKSCDTTMSNGRFYDVCKECQSGFNMTGIDRNKVGVYDTLKNVRCTK